LVVQLEAVADKRVEHTETEELSSPKPAAAAESEECTLMEHEATEYSTVKQTESEASSSLKRSPSDVVETEECVVVKQGAIADSAVGVE